jgi:hypothetical protein
VSRNISGIKCDEGKKEGKKRVKEKKVKCLWPIKCISSQETPNCKIYIKNIESVLFRRVKLKSFHMIYFEV